MMKNERDCGKMIDNQELSIEYSWLGFFLRI